MEGRLTKQVRRILRSPSLKRKSRLVPVSEKVLLERVYGLTVTNDAALDTDPATGTIAYPAGCVIVMYNSHTNKQSHICNQCKKTITCLAFSPDGKLLVTGESGHLPAVRVWDLEDNTPIAQFSGHQFGINCVAFSPNLKYIVSVGTQHDMMVNVWNWKTNTKVASNKVASKVVSIAFTEDGTSFVTVGNRHVKFWYLDASKSRLKETVPLLGRSGILGDRKNNFFNGVSCGRGDTAGNTYCITQSGLLCEFNEKRLLNKWVELRTPCAYSLTVGENYLYVGCAEGIVRIFNCRTLNYLSTLPRPHPLGVDVAAAVDLSQLGAPQENSACYPDTVAVSLDEDSHKLTCVYNDHSLYIWDVHDIHKIGKTRSFLYHSACIWSAEMYPNVDENAALPPGSFITCSSDDTIRMWNMDMHATTDHATTDHVTVRRNIYSSELLKVIYTDPELNNIKNIKFNPAGKTDMTDTGFLEKNGVRSVRICPTGQHMASGDRAGNIRIHDLHTMEQCHILEAHDSEVLCLEFTNPNTTGVHFLSSASRDRLIHVFDAGQQYGLVQTLDDHSSAITSIKFAEDGEKLHMISCGVDKSLLFRTAQMTPHFQFVLNRHLVGKTTLYDMDVDATKKFVATACQDRNVRIYSIKNGKKKKCYSGSVGSDGTLIRVELDQSGAYLATTCSNKNICLYDFFSGELIASMYGHSEVVTGVKFMNDLKHLISVSADGCIFVWRLPPEVTEHMHSRMVELGKTATLNVPWQVNMSEVSSEKMSDQKGGFSDVMGLLENNFPDDEAPSIPEQDHKANYRFSVGQLPSWAKKQMLLGSGSQPPMGDVDVKTAAPRGRWAENPGIVMKSVLEENSPMKLPLVDALNCQRFPAAQNKVSDVLQSQCRETVPVVDDDEFNQDDSDDDEFKVLSMWKKDTSLQENAQSDRLSFTRSCEFRPRDLTESEDRNDSGDREVIYYPSSTLDFDSSTTQSSTFHVFDSNKLKGQDDAGLDDMSEDETDTPQTSSPSTPATEHMKAFPGEDTDTAFMQNNYESLTETEKFDTKLEDVKENSDGLAMFPTARLSFSRKFLSNAPSRYPLRNNHTHQSSRQSKTVPPAVQTAVSSAADITSATDEKINPASAVRHMDTAQQKTASTQQQRTKWLSGEGTKLSLSSRGWKSMLNVADSSDGKEERAPRSRTPNPSHFVRRSFTPTTAHYVVNDRHKPVTKVPCAPRHTHRASHLPQPAGGSYELKLPPRRRSTRDEKAAPERPSSTRPNGEKTIKAVTMRLHSYSKATESSKAKKMPRVSSINQVYRCDDAGAFRSVGVTSNATDPRLTRRSHPSRKGNLSAAQKAKFKSTPNLSELNDVSPTMSGSKTMEDLDTADIMAKTATLPGGHRGHRIGKDRSQHSMLLPQDTVGLFSTAESSVYRVDQPLNTTFSILSSHTQASLVTVRHPNNDEEADRTDMPPPASHVTKPAEASHVTQSPASRDQTASSSSRRQELSLAEAKDILRGRHHRTGAGCDKSEVSTLLLPDSEKATDSTPVMSSVGSEEVERDNRFEPSPLEPPVKDSNVTVGQHDAMPRVSTEPVLGACRVRTTWHSSTVRPEARPRHRSGAHRRSYSPSPLTLARTLSPMTVVKIDSDIVMPVTSTCIPTQSQSVDRLVSTTDVSHRTPVGGPLDPAVRQAAVTTSQSDTSQGSNDQQELNDFFMSLLSRSSSNASDADESLSDDRPKRGHTAAARSLWERTIQQRDAAQARRPGVRSKGVRVDANANCVQGEVDVVSEVTESERKRLELARTYISARSRSVVTPLLPLTSDVGPSEEMRSPASTSALGATATSPSEIPSNKSKSPPAADLCFPVKSSSPPVSDISVTDNSSSHPVADIPVTDESTSPLIADIPVTDESTSPLIADIPVTDESTSPLIADIPVTDESTSPLIADLTVTDESTSPLIADIPVTDESTSPLIADIPVTDESTSPLIADIPVTDESTSPLIADLTVPDESSSTPTVDLSLLDKSDSHIADSLDLNTYDSSHTADQPIPDKFISPTNAGISVPVKFSSPPKAELPIVDKSSSPPTAILSVPDRSSPPPTVDTPVPDKAKSPPSTDFTVSERSSLAPIVDLPVPITSSSSPSADLVNNKSVTESPASPAQVKCIDKQEVPVPTQAVSVNPQVRANRSRLNLPLEGTTSVANPTDYTSAEQTCSYVDVAIQEALTMYSKVCNEGDMAGDKRELLKRTLQHTRQLIDDTLGDRVSLFTSVTSTHTTTDVDAGTAMLEHYSVQLADRVCALVQRRLRPPTEDITRSTKL